MGITLYIMAIGKYPFSGTNIYTICESIAKGEYFLPDTLEPELAALIKGILQVDPGSRMTLQDMKNNSWVTTDIVSDEPLLPYVNTETGTPHNIFAQNYRVSAGQGLYSSATDGEEEEPTVYTLDESENSTYSSGTTQQAHYKLRDSSTDSPSQSMTALPSVTLTTTTPHSPAPTKRRSKARCVVM
jgi:serine/threonine protein kinase